MRLQLAANSVSVWVQLRWLGFPFHVVFHPGLHPAWWSRGSKRANPSAQALACVMFVDISLAKVSHMANVGGVYTLTSTLKDMIHWRPSLSQATTHSRLCCDRDQNSSKPV